MDYTENRKVKNTRQARAMAKGTRFIPDALGSPFERTSWPIAASDPGAGARPLPAVDLAARMRGVWS